MAEREVFIDGVRYVRAPEPYSDVAAAIKRRTGITVSTETIAQFYKGELARA
jgi:hypothetical protein